MLRNYRISKPDQVWSTDITYIPLKKGRAYLVAVMDWYSRKILSWQVSNTLDASFCVVALNEALSSGKMSEIFNSDQGSQFTSKEFTGVLKDKDIRISMDFKGRAFDNIFVERLWRTIKYEDIYIKGYENMKELRDGLNQYIKKYNTERLHQNLDYNTPDDVYFNNVTNISDIINQAKI